MYLQEHASTSLTSLVFRDSRGSPRRPSRPHPHLPSGLEQAAEELLRRDATYRRHTRAVVRLQDALRGQVNERAWQEYLTLEERESERDAYALRRVAEWAFAHGRRRRPTATRRE